MSVVLLVDHLTLPAESRCPVCCEKLPILCSTEQYYLFFFMCEVSWVACSMSPVAILGYLIRNCPSPCLFLFSLPGCFDFCFVPGAGSVAAVRYRAGLTSTVPMWGPMGREHRSPTRSFVDVENIALDQIRFHQIRSDQITTQTSRATCRFPSCRGSAAVGHPPLPSLFLSAS